MTVIPLPDPDLFGSAATSAMIEHLSGPFRAGAGETILVVDGTGASRVDFTAREPLLLVVLKVSLGVERLDLTAAVIPDAGPPPPGVALTFEPFSERGAALPLYRPEVDPITQIAGPMSITLAKGGTTPAAGIGDLVEVRVVEGVLEREI